MWRAVACLTLGWVLWLPTGAVSGAGSGQVSGADYLVGLTLAGTALGAGWPGHHLATGAWLVLPGAASFVALAATTGAADALWWTLTLGLGVYLAAGGHRLGSAARRAAGAAHRAGDRRSRRRGDRPARRRRLRDPG